jgi:hypothetical protein
VLGLGETRDRPVPIVRSQFTPHTGVKCDLGAISPRPGVPARPELRAT